MEYLKYIELLSKTTDYKEIENLLRGYDGKIFQPSQYAGGDLVDAGEVLSRVVYPACKINPSVKEEVEQVLYEMLSGTDCDVYIVTRYVMSEIFKEKNGIAPFQMDLGKILAKLKKELDLRESTIRSGILYPNGYRKTSAWEDLIRFRNVYKQEYKVTLF